MTSTENKYKEAFFSLLNIKDFIDNLDDEQREQAKVYLGVESNSDENERMKDLIVKSSYELYRIESLIRGVVLLLQEGEGPVIEKAVEAMGNAAAVAGFAEAHIAKLAESFDAIV